VKVYIIDNGVNLGCFPLPYIAASLRVRDDGSIVPRQDELGNVSHGTVCAAVMGRINPEIELVDIAALDADGKAYIAKLSAALRWCDEEPARIIHMSLGTLDWRDLRELAEPIEALLEGGAMIIAAFHNTGLKSFPALMPGVFGVRADRGGYMDDGEYTIDLCDGMRAENCLVAHCGAVLELPSGRRVETAGANSYAAPVITAHIAKLLDSNPGLSFNDLLDQLMLRSSHHAFEAPKIIPYRMGAGIPGAKCPVAAFLYSAKEVFLMFSHRLRGDGYAVFSFSDFCDESGAEDIIPLQHYLSHGEIVCKGLTHTLEYIYRPDIVLLCMREERVCNGKVFEGIDALIMSDNGEYILRVEEYSHGDLSAESVITEMLEYFETGGASLDSVSQ
jgi:hypothetical protein